MTTGHSRTDNLVTTRHSHGPALQTDNLVTTRHSHGPVLRTDNLVTTRHSHGPVLRTDKLVTTRHSHGPVSRIDKLVTTRHSHGPVSRTNSLTTRETREEGEDKVFLTDFKEYVLTHTNVMSEEEMNDLPILKHLGEGSFGTVDLVNFKGRDAIRKASKSGGDPTMFLWEARVTLEVDGAGGAPRLHALTTKPAMAVMDYAGTSLLRTLVKGCTMGTFLRVVVGLAKSLAEVHAKGFVHNDIKCDNITVTGRPSSPSVHVIDFGLATKVNDSFYFELFNWPRNPDYQHPSDYRSPELKKGEPLQPSSDVFSVGVMLRDVCKCTKHRRLNELLMPLAKACMEDWPEDRPSLSKMEQDVQNMVSILTDNEENHVLAPRRKGRGGKR